MDHATWEAKAVKDNRGRTPQSLAYRPEPGIELGPHVSEAPVASRGLAPTGGWRAIRTHANPTSEAIKADLDGGIQGIRLDRRALRGARDLAACMKGVDVENVHWAFAEGDFGSAAAMVGLWRGLGFGPTMDVQFGLDPLSRFGRDGFHQGSLATRMEAAAELAGWIASTYPQARTFDLDGSIWHAAGADDAVAIGLTLSNLVACLRAMDAQGIDTADAFGQIGLRLAVGGNFLLGIATLRATRRIVGRLAELCGVEADVPITATAATREHTRYDPAVNILRLTVSAFGGIVGGADAVDLPSWTASETPESARLARNTQTILREEAHLGRVADPAGGSWAIESLTDQVAQSAWKVFQSIEGQGGLQAALRNGNVAERLQNCRARREKYLRTRATSVLGVSRFADLGEGQQPQRYEEDEATALRSDVDAAGSFADLLADALRLPMATMDEARVPHTAIERCEPSPAWHRATMFEDLRDRPNAPAAYIAPLGTLAQHTARSAFGQELLAAGGIPASIGNGSTVDEAVQGYQASGARIAVVSATGSRFSTDGPTLVKALRAAGAAVWVLGDPGDQRPDFERAGAVGFLYQGIDVYAALRTLWETR